MITIGIDNGVSGAIAAISDDPSTGLIASIKMPLKATRKGNEVEVSEVLAFHVSMAALAGGIESVRVVIEEPGGAKSYKAAVSMAASFHAIRGMLDVWGVRYHRVTPKQWQDKMLGKVKKGDTKRVALTRAKTLWPKETWFPTARCSKPNDGIIDAALIAEYGRRERL
jgi:hypothetical protein